MPAHVGLPGSNVITSKSWKGSEVSIIRQLGCCRCGALVVGFGGNGQIIEIYGLFVGNFIITRPVSGHEIVNIDYL